MKKITFLTLMIISWAISPMIYADGLETFANFPETGNTYEDGTFIGQDGSTWTYYQCRGDKLITNETPCLGKDRVPTAEVCSGTISGGCLTLNFDYMQAFSTNVNLEVYINSFLVTTITTLAEQGIVKNTGDINVNIPGDFTIKFIQTDDLSGQVSIDNIAWISGGAINPEPTNYPTNFVASAEGFSINLDWDDATGEQLPLAYLIFGSDNANIDPPEDGIPVEDDINLSDGWATVNVSYGVETYTFTGLPSSSTYYFKIFPYTNTGSDIDYKTDGTPPEASATTPDLAIINFEDFNDTTLGTWAQISVVGPDQFWYIEDHYGIEDSPCAKMSGYSGGSNENDDWLISPPMNFANFTNESFSFFSALNYTGPDLEVKISVDYDGGGDPYSATWTILTAELSQGGWQWTASGNIDVSGFNGTAVYIAFQYTSNNQESATWEVDNILITGEGNTGINEFTGGFEYKIYPNPANENLNVNVAEGNYELKIHTILGKLVFAKSINSKTNTLNLSELDKGIYFVTIRDNKSGYMVSEKLVVN